MVNDNTCGHICCSPDAEDGCTIGSCLDHPTHEIAEDAMNSLAHWNDIHANWEEKNTAEVRAGEMITAWNTIAEIVPLEGRFLEIGCSSGGLMVRLAERPDDQLEMWGSDFSPIAVRLAQAALPLIADRLIVHDAREPLPYGDSTFETVFCGHLIEHLPDPVPLMREMKRVITGDGIVIIEFPYHDPPYPEHVHSMLDYERVSAWIAAAGLVVDECLPVIDMEPTKDGIVIASDPCL